MVRKSNTRTPTPSKQIKVEPGISTVKDLLADNIDGHVIYFCDEATRIARPDAKTSTSYEQIKVEPNIAMVKDLLVDNIDGHVIYF